MSKKKKTATPPSSPPSHGGESRGVNFPKMEEEILKFWEREKIFEKSLEKTTPSSSPPIPPRRDRGRKKKEVSPPSPERGRIRGGTPFVFYEGPPTANAPPGFHSVEARAFKDLFPRYQTMRGRYVARKSGWDTHGLPVELQIEKKLGISGKKQIESLKGTVRESIAYFNKLCKESVWQYKEEWENLTRRMGFWIDLKHPYITYENSYIEAVWGVLKNVWEKGLIYQGHKVVPYCPRCGTALSSHEVAQGYETVTDNSVTVKFQIPNSKSQINSKFKIPNSKPIYLLSWTTTPWTLPGNVALAVNPSIKYQVVSIKGENYIVAKDRITTVIPDPVSSTGQALIGDPGLPSTAIGGLDSRLRGNDNIFKGRDLVGLEYEPLFDLSQTYADKSKPINGHATEEGSAPIPDRSRGQVYRQKAYKVYPADFVTTDEGTGIVHTAVMYGEDDYELGEKVGLPKRHTVDEEGKFTSDLAAYGLKGKFVKSKEAEEKIISYLKSKDLLFKEEPYTHDYPFCWRCGTPLLYYARNSWFIKMSALRDKLIKNNQKINWIPEYIKEGRFGQWLAEVKDWAISRERYWGTPLPFWKCKKCGDTIVIGSIQELRERTSSGLRPPSPGVGEGLGERSFDLHRPFVDEIVLKCEKCGGQAKRVPEVLDVWFDSGAMPFASGQNKFPADFICEAIDQTRGWFYTLLAVSTLLGKGPAYKNVICLGHVLDEKGEKMSKSKGNVVDPWEVGKKYGFDAIRWYFYTVNQPGDGKAFREKDLAEVVKKVHLILWNVYNYFVTYANEGKWTPSSSPSPPIRQRRTGGEREGVLDEWILARLQELINRVTEHLDHYDTFHAAREIEKFINELSTWYLRRSRGRNDEGFFVTLHYCLIELSKIIAPFMPYLSEVIYRNLYKSINGHATDQKERSSAPIYRHSVHLSDWPKTKKLTKKQQELLTQMQQIRGIAEAAHALRAKAGIKLRQKLAHLVIPVRLRRRNPMDPRVSSLPPRRRGPEDDSLLAILKSEVNVQEIIFGKKLELDTTITPELRLEGLARELERQIQQFRKESGLKIGEMVDLYYETKSDMIKKAMKLVGRKKIYVSSVILEEARRGGPTIGSKILTRTTTPDSIGPSGLQNDKLREKEIEIEGERIKFLISN